MPVNPFPAEVIVAALEAEAAGSSVVQVCDQFAITDTTFYNWRKRFAGLSVEGIQQLQVLEAENRQLKKELKGLLLDKQVMQLVIEQQLDKERRQACLKPALQSLPVTESRLRKILSLK